jgi:translation elongation factor EF-1alpha
MSQHTAFPIVIVGHVDHGKSTLVGRLMHETGALAEGAVEALQASSDKRGSVFEWSHLLDALQIERDQGITLDTTQVWFASEARRYVIIDAPGHKEFLKNMVTGAAAADAAKTALAAAAVEIAAKFEPQANDPKSTAKPDVWTNWDDFVKKGEALKTAAEAMDATTVEGVQAGMGAIGGSCKDCHTSYRIPS